MTRHLENEPDPPLGGPLHTAVWFAAVAGSALAWYYILPLIF